MNMDWLRGSHALDLLSWLREQREAGASAGGILVALETKLSELVTDTSGALAARPSPDEEIARAASAPGWPGPAMPDGYVSGGRRTWAAVAMRWWMRASGEGAATWRDLLDARAGAALEAEGEALEKALASVGAVAIRWLSAIRARAESAPVEAPGPQRSEVRSGRARGLRVVIQGDDGSEEPVAD